MPSPTTTSNQPLQEIFLGTMSGTSMDGLDLVTASFDKAGSPSLLHTGFTPYPTELKNALIQLATNPSATIDQMCALDTRLGEFYAASILQFLEKHDLSAASIRAVGNHGQTIRHQPGGDSPYTLQIGNPAIIAARCGLTVISDFRRKDIALGGQGAPLAPAFHQQAFQAQQQDRVILNIGGIANITALPSSPAKAITGYDTGPGNTLIDALCRRHFAQEFDRDGEIASNGQIESTLVQKALGSEPYFKQPPPKSTGTDYFNESWLAAQGFNDLSPDDAVATASELTCRSVAMAIDTLSSRASGVYVCGGGAHNRFIMQRLSSLLPDCQVATTESLGIHPDWIEAAAFAWLAWRNLSGLSGNLPSVTNAKKCTILGTIQH